MSALLALGPHVFEIAPLNYQNLQKKAEFRWAGPEPGLAPVRLAHEVVYSLCLSENSSGPGRLGKEHRLSREPTRQFTGPGSTSISISGLMFPDTLHGYEDYKAIERTGRKGRPLMMVGGTGLVFGKVVILLVSETHQVIGARGAPAKMEFSCG